MTRITDQEPTKWTLKQLYNYLILGDPDANLLDPASPVAPQRKDDHDQDP